MKEVKTPAKHQTYADKMKAEGFSKVCVYAPDPKVVIDYASKKRKAFLKARNA